MVMCLILYLVWVNSNAKESGVSVNQLIDVSDPQIPEDGRVIEISEVGHVLATVELWRIHLTDLILFVHFFLQKNVKVIFRK